jgi:hypothetical protein
MSETSDSATKACGLCRISKCKYDRKNNKRLENVVGYLQESLITPPLLCLVEPWMMDGWRGEGGEMREPGNRVRGAVRWLE